MCVWEGSCVKLKQKSILPVDISHDRTPTTRLEKEVGGFLEYPHPSQPQHNTLRAQPRWIKIHASQHPASKNRFRSEEWWWRCCKTVGRGKFCEMWLWNVCEDCSYHHTLGGDDPSLGARVCYSDQPGEWRREAVSHQTSQRLSSCAWAHLRSRKRRQRKNTNDTNVTSMTREQKRQCCIWIFIWIKKNFFSSTL